MKTIPTTEICKKIGRTEKEWSDLIGFSINGALGTFQITGLETNSEGKIISLVISQGASIQELTINNLQSRFRSITLSQSIFKKIFFHQQYLEEQENIKLEHIQKLKIEKERAEKAAKEQKYLDKLSIQLRDDYLNSEHYYNSELKNKIAEQSFIQHRCDFVANWVEENKLGPVDAQQAQAIADTNHHTLVTARAGSGKTATLVNKIIFLNQHCHIHETEFLILVFNTKAAQEIRDRLKVKTGKEFPNVMTFHSLAYSIVRPEEAIIYDNPKNEEFNLTSKIQSIIDDHIRSPKWSPKIRDLMLSYFKEDWEAITAAGSDLLPQDILKFRRSLPKIGLDGCYYKSKGEKLIADYFFEHDIGFEYERNFWWNKINYKPDFTIRKKTGGIVVEFFGIQNNEDYKAQIIEKQNYWQQKENWELWEIYPNMINSTNTFQKVLAKKLTASGFVLEKLSDEEIWEKIQDRAIDNFSTVCKDFISRARQEMLSEKTLYSLIQDHKHSFAKEELFLEIIQNIYGTYLDYLKDAGEEDFPGLLARASEKIMSGNTKVYKKNHITDLTTLKICMVDEYQDFSKLFFQCLTAIKSQNINLNLFCVGDNWQAINRFAGADTIYFNKFENYFDHPTQIEIKTNYRSAKAIVAAGNSLMKNQGFAAESNKNEQGAIKLVDLSKFENTIIEKHKFRDQFFVPALLRICLKFLRNEKSVTLLSRTNKIRWPNSLFPSKLEDFLSEFKKLIPEKFHQKLSASTIHSFKGKQADTIIIIDFKQNFYPFLHPRGNFTRIFGDNLNTMLADELNLLYVAITRAKEDLFLFTEAGEEPMSLNDFRSQVSLINWQGFPEVTAEKSSQSVHIIVIRGNTFPIRSILNKLSFRWSTHNKTWSRRMNLKEDEIENYLLQTNWLPHLTEGTIEVIAENGENKFLVDIKHGLITRKISSN